MLLLSVCFRVTQFSTHFPSLIPRLRKPQATAVVPSLNRLRSQYYTCISPLALNPKSTSLKIQRLSSSKPWTASLCRAHAVLWTILQNYSCWTQQLFLCQWSNKGGTALPLSADSLHWGIGYFSDVLCKREQGPLGILILLVLLILSLWAPFGSSSCFNPRWSYFLLSFSSVIELQTFTPTCTERTLSDGPFTLPQGRSEPRGYS